MLAPQIDQRVRLTRSVPELELDSGREGVVRSVWFAPSLTYEVEFADTRMRYPIRALLNAECIQLAGDRQWEE